MLTGCVCPLPGSSLAPLCFLASTSRARACRREAKPKPSLSKAFQTTLTQGRLNACFQKCRYEPDGKAIQAPTPTPTSTSTAASTPGSRLVFPLVRAGADTKRLPLQQRQRQRQQQQQQQQQQQPLLLRFRGRGRRILPTAKKTAGRIHSRSRTINRTKSGSEGGLDMRLGGMFVNGGLSPTVVAVAVLGVVAPAFLAWLVQPLVSARAHRGTAFESEGFFWGVGKEGARTEKEAFPTLDHTPTKTLSVIVPAHNEENRLPGMLKETLAYLDGKRTEADFSSSSSSSASSSSVPPPFTYEVIVVDDGSTDATAAVVEKWVEELGTDVVRLLTLSENQGKGAAVGKGMLRMRGEYGIMVDADAATDIQDLDQLLVRMREIEREEMVQGSGGDGRVKHGMVVGSRAHMEGDAVAKRALYRTVLMLVFHWCVSFLCTRDIKDTQCGFKLFTRDTAAVVFGSLHLERWAFDIEIIKICQLVGIPMSEVAVNWHEVPGSKLIQSKLDVMTTSATMLRDMLCVKVCYMLGIWEVAHDKLTAPKKKR